MLAVGSAAPVLALVGWLLAGLPLALAGWFSPWAMWPAGVALAAATVWYGLRRLPETVPATALQTGAVLAVTAASGVLNAILHTEQLIVRRDPASYAQYTIWLAGHGRVPIPADAAAFGGPDPALRFDSMGFYLQDGVIVPQFMPGTPILNAAAQWLGGVGGLLLAPPVLGALAVLVFAGTVARLAGARWAPLAALTFAVCLPILYTSRSIFSEIPSLILLFGGMTLMLDARFRVRSGLTGVGYLPADRDEQPAGAMRSALLAGLAFGLALLVRIDGLRDVLPVLAYGGVLIALDRVSRGEGKRIFPDGRLGVPLLVGLGVGSACGFVAGYFLARPYLEYLSGSLVPLVAVCAVVLVLTAVGAAFAPRITWRSVRWLPEIAAGLVGLILVAFAVRPWLETVRRTPTTPEDELTARFIEATQLANGLPIDRERLYYEDSLYWVVWYVGVPVVVLATLAAAVLVRRMARGRGFVWLLPLAIIGWTTVTTLYRPAITPDHPFAARRLVPIVLPGLILLAVWGLRRLRDRARKSGYGSRLLLAAGALLIVVPAAVTSIGTAFTPIERGEAAAVAGLCAAIPPDAPVLIVERVTGDRYTQLIRGQCGHPAARVALPGAADVAAEADVRRLVAATRATGRVPVLLAAESDQLARYGHPVQALGLVTRQDERSLTHPPDGTWTLTTNVWLAVPDN
ncbi:hypothetical protein Aph01nite_03620 [Acrocarpospora phusangensis]|uniref:Glycosyltransferase RgtA/B/C/D-like domain-containing protein n=1 Tax=Acrocarpospora phusangensis TaxID=1070424 RepID=A0A919ULD2_9ACTN|nr:hypothetical protein [Acrocarpospora phusangensis]GIH22052.1 hypothetical protein Aph01nite_03620 [Acrocarpospora phusangensis]